MTQRLKEIIEDKITRAAKSRNYFIVPFEGEKLSLFKELRQTPIYKYATTRFRNDFSQKGSSTEVIMLNNRECYSITADYYETPTTELILKFCSDAVIRLPPIISQSVLSNWNYNDFLLASEDNYLINCIISDVTLPVSETAVTRFTNCLFAEPIEDGSLELTDVPRFYSTNGIVGENIILEPYSALLRKLQCINIDISDLIQNVPQTIQLVGAPLESDVWATVCRFTQAARYFKSLSSALAQIDQNGFRKSQLDIEKAIDLFLN